jgi:Sugar-specific transcriptional regulator TrmB.
MDYKALEDGIVNLLNISRDDAKIYILLVTQGAMNLKDIAYRLNMDVNDTKDALARLVYHYGACIELNGKYEALNPKFAITNIYRMKCLSDGKLRRDQAVDSIANILAKVYDSVRGREDE